MSLLSVDGIFYFYLGVAPLLGSMLTAISGLRRRQHRHRMLIAPGKWLYRCCRVPGDHRSGSSRAPTVSKHGSFGDKFGHGLTQSAVRRPTPPDRPPGQSCRTITCTIGHQTRPLRAASGQASIRQVAGVPDLKPKMKSDEIGSSGLAASATSTRPAADSRDVSLDSARGGRILLLDPAVGQEHTLMVLAGPSRASSAS